MMGVTPFRWSRHLAPAAERLPRSPSRRKSSLMRAPLRALPAALFLGVLCTATPKRDATRAVGPPPADPVRPLLARYCVSCHGAVKPKGKFRLDNLPHEFSDDVNRERWLAVSRRLKAGEMPPEG